VREINNTCEKVQLTKAFFAIFHSFHLLHNKSVVANPIALEISLHEVKFSFLFIFIFLTLKSVSDISDRLCGLVVKVPGYRFRGPGSILGATRFFLRSSGSGTGSTQPRDDN
jgi:hypothetical protein